MTHTVRRLVCCLVCVAGLGWLGPVAHAQETNPYVQLAKKMRQPVDVPAIQDPAPLHEILALLNKLTGVRFDVNDRAFDMDNGPGAAARLPELDNLFLVVAQDKAGAGDKAGGKKPTPPAKPAPPPPPGGNRVSNTEITVHGMSKLRLETVLKKLLAQIPTGNATYVIRREGVEITTLRAKQQEFYRSTDHPMAPPDPNEDATDNFRFLPLVQVDFHKRPLEEALSELADATDFSIILDPRAADKTKAVTATLINVPLDTAVELLADLSGMKVLMRDRALYVTTKDNAVALQKEQRDRTPQGIQVHPGMFGPGVPGAPGTAPGVSPLIPPGVGVPK